MFRKPKLKRKLGQVEEQGEGMKAKLLIFLIYIYLGGQVEGFLFSKQEIMPHLELW